MRDSIPYKLRPLLLILLFICTISLFIPYCSSADLINLTLVGDVFLGNWLEDYIQEDPSYPFLYIQEILAQGDLLIGNLEAPLSLKGEVYVEKTYTLHCPPHAVKTLEAGGFDGVTLANNHIMDFGPEALFETITVLDNNNIKHAGAGANLQEARAPAFFEKNGLIVALLAYNNTLPLEFNASTNSPGTAQGKWEYIEKDVKAAKKSADLVVVSFHWSAELLKEPKPYQKSLARLCIDSGADIVFGHHPHVIQGIELYKDRVIAYSLGNFIFSSYSKKVKESVILQVTSGKNGPRSVRIYPVNVNNHQVAFRPKPLSNQAALAFLEEIRTLSAEFGTPLNIQGDWGEIIIPENNPD